MIKIVNSENSRDIDTIPMNQMKPLQVAEIVRGTTHKGDIVMRTASEDTFEVMNLTRPGPDVCWNAVSDSVIVQLIKYSITIEIFNEK